jgi:uncharacterized membrane protein YbaN (DUF454 family)
MKKFKRNQLFIPVSRCIKFSAKLQRMLLKSKLRSNHLQKVHEKTFVGGKKFKDITLCMCAPLGCVCTFNAYKNIKQNISFQILLSQSCLFFSKTFFYTF